MANRKLKSLKFPGIDDTYILDAGNVNYSDEETYEKGSVGKGLNALKEDIKDNYAKNDGYYDGMTVGNAEQIVGTVFEEDDTAYNRRTTGGSAEVGDRAYVDAIVGGSLPWNQLTRIRNGGSSYTELGVTITNNSGVFEFSGTLQSYTYISVLDNLQIVTNHKYLLDSKIIANPNNLSFQYSMLNANPQVDIGNSTIQSSIYTKATGFGFANMTVGADYTGVKLYLNCFDLTAMFGSTIADYIYALETAHAGDGVAWFKRYFPKPYYAYHAVGMEHVNAVSARTVGFNQLDNAAENWEVGYYDMTTGQPTSADQGARRYKTPIRVFPNTPYYANTSFVRWLSYDSNDNFISSQYGGSGQVYVTPNNAYYMRIYIGSGYPSGTLENFNLSIHWDNSRDGDYEPYNLHTYPLADLTLRGIPKKDESGNLYYDGDRYLPDGTVERRYGIIDLGTLTWEYDTAGTYPVFFSANLASLIKTPSTANTDIVCISPNYITIWYSNAARSVVRDVMDNKCVVITNSGTTNRIIIRDDSYSDAASFKTAMSGVYLVYELAEPTTEEADPYQYPMVVDNWGTEELIDGKVESGDRDVAIPVGHETKYPPNLKDKLESAANNPDSDGAYILTHDGGSNTYTPLASNPTIQNIIARLEALEGGGE